MGEAPPKKENLKNAKMCVQSQKEVKNENWEAIREEKEVWKYYYTSFHIHLIGYIDHMEPPEAGEKFGYKVILEEGRVVDFLHKSKRRKHLRRAVSYFLSHTGYLVGCPGGMDSYRWSGTCSNNAFSLTAEEMEAMESPLKPKGCLICGAPVINVYICLNL